MVLLRRVMPDIAVIPVRWLREVFREIFIYGVNFQLIVVMRMFFDPITKCLLSHFGGLAIVGYYEMASKLVIQVRQILISANRAIVPVVAELFETNREEIHSLYRRNYMLFIFLSLGVHTGVMVGGPLISKAWIGWYEGAFLYSLTLLCIGWLLNSPNVPSFFLFMGIGKLKYNVISTALIGIANLGLGYALGVTFGWKGVIAGWVIALGAGSSVIYIAYHKLYNIRLAELWPREVRGLSVICLLLVGISLFVNFVLAVHEDTMGLVLAVSALSVATLFLLICCNTLCGVIVELVREALRRPTVRDGVAG
jgi:O-antigen/teichoic acid export membrane protein